MSSLTLSGPMLLSDGRMTDATLWIENDVIDQVTLGIKRQADVVTTGCIAPGFIDLQISGGYGLDFTTDGRAIVEVAARLPATGVTAFLPTLIAAPLDVYAQRFAEITAVIRQISGAQVLGVHLEGPYLNPLRRGSYDAGLLRPIDMLELRRWANHPLIRIMTLAPELPHALEAIRFLYANGVVVSAGHSNATYAQVEAGLAAGMSWGTHMFNSMGELHQREPGLAGALLLAGVPCGVIADGIHVHPAMLQLAMRSKGVTGLTLVTDAMAAMGLPVGEHTLGDRCVTVDAKSARLADGSIAGSILTMDQAVRNMMSFTGCSRAEALTMASTTPAQVLGLQSSGKLSPTYRADVVILDPDMRVTHTFIGGQLAWSAEGS